MSLETQINTKKIQIALINPEIPQNVGTTIRTCAGLNITLHIIHPLGFIWDEKLLKRSGMDYISHCKIIHHNSFEKFIQYANGEKFETVSTICSSIKHIVPENFHNFQYKENQIIIFGKESEGLSAHELDQISKHITIPMHHNPEYPNSLRSFNIAISIGMILSQAIFSSDI